MSDNSGKIEWYLAREGQQHGPLSDVELDKFIELGHLEPMDLLWRAGFDDWRPATDVFPPRPPVPAAAPQMPTTAPAPHAAAAQADELRPGETTQPIRQHNVAHDEHTGATGTPVAGAPQSTAAYQSNQQTGFEPGNAAPEHTPSASHPVPQTPVRLADPSVRVQPSGGFGHPQNTASAVTQRPLHPDPMFGAEPQSNALRPGPSASQQHANARPDELDDDEFLEVETDGRSGWLMVAAALFLFVILGAGGLFAYNNQQQFSALFADLTSDVKPNDVAVVRAPQSASREAAGSKTAPATTVARLNTTKPVAPAQPVPELPILKSKLWQFAQKEFGSWTQLRLAELGEETKSKQEANDYLIASFVRLRRDNAQHALLASPGSLARVATSFVDSLRALTAKGFNECYSFISNGEGSPVVAPLFFEPDIGSKLEAQMLAILQAIAEGKASPIDGRKPPTAADFNALSTELGKSGWTAADLKLFSDPSALSKAKPKVVCRLVTEWFATQTKLGDQATRDQLIAASLRPVIGG